MKAIKITKENTGKIVEAIRKAEGRATARTITAEDIFKAVEEVEAHLNLPKKYLKGISVWCDMNSQKFHGCYNGRPQSTQFKIVRRSSAWFIYNIIRYDTDRSRQYRLWLPSMATEYIQNHAVLNAMSF